MIGDGRDVDEETGAYRRNEDRLGGDLGHVVVLTTVRHHRLDQEKDSKTSGCYRCWEQVGLDVRQIDNDDCHCW